MDQSRWSRPVNLNFPVRPRRDRLSNSRSVPRQALGALPGRHDPGRPTGQLVTHHAPPLHDGQYRVIVSAFSRALRTRPGLTVVPMQPLGRLVVDHSLTGRDSRLPIEHAVLHHQLYLAQGFDVLGWITLDTNQVGPKSWFDGTQAIIEPQGLGGDGGCCS